MPAPAVMPVITAVVSVMPAAVAAALPLAHTPPAVVSERMMDWPTHTDDGPSMGDTGLMMMLFMDWQPVPRV